MSRSDARICSAIACLWVLVTGGCSPRFFDTAMWLDDVDLVAWRNAVDQPPLWEAWDWVRCYRRTVNGRDRAGRNTAGPLPAPAHNNARKAFS
jgi:hypothetical protein